MTAILLLALSNVEGLALLATALQDGEAKDFNGLPYRLIKPAKTEGKLPLVIFLHGAGERGDNNVAQLTHGVKAFVAAQAKFPHFLIAPQCPKNKKWAEVDWGADRHKTPAEPSEPMGKLLALIDKLQEELPIDPSRIYVTGLSMGGFGTWDLLTRRPQLIAAAVPICGGGDVDAAPTIAKIPQWIFHGGNDTVVKTARSRAMNEALTKAGGMPKYTEYPGVGHDSWNKAYAEPDLMPWLFAQKKK
jgi:predicted peptidase